MNNLNKKTAVQSAQLRQLFSASKVSLVTSTLLASILAYAQREMIASTVVIIWFSLILLVAFSRTVLVNAYQASSLDNEATTHFWLTRFRIGVLAVGVVWGSAGFLMFPINSPQHQMLLIFMLAGLSAGGVVAFSADSDKCGFIFHYIPCANHFSLIYHWRQAICDYGHSGNIVPQFHDCQLSPY